MKTLTIDTQNVQGRIKPLHGVGSGPLTGNFSFDMRDAYREAGIPFGRTHDTEYPFGSGAFVDIPCIFRNFDADVNAPESYDFSQTDLYIQAILDAGAKPFYRLGVSIEHTPVKRNIYAPKDPEKWAQICEHIIAHYNEGWNNGMHAGIEYWEIWNEPESPNMWIGTREQLFELYEHAARRLKNRFPNIKIGGYASCGFYALTEIPADLPESELTNGQKRWKTFVEYADAFLAFCVEKKLPLDFYSWHLYHSNPETYAVHAQYVRALLDRYGFTATESVLDEWNLSGQDMFNRMVTREGAAHAAAVMCQMQNNHVDAATYYDAQPAMPYCGIFYENTSKPTPTFYSFKFWNRLHELGNLVPVSVSGDHVYAAAAVSDDGKTRALLISHYTAEDAQISVEFQNLPKKASYTMLGVDAVHLDTEVNHGPLYDDYPYARWIAPGFGAYLIEIHDQD